MSTPTSLDPILDQVLDHFRDDIKDHLDLGEVVIWDLNAQTVMLPTPQGIAMQAMYVLTVWLKNPLLGHGPLAAVHQFADPWEMFDHSARPKAVAQALAVLRQQRTNVLAQQNGHAN